MTETKKNLVDISKIVTVALACPFAILLPPFNDLLKQSEDEIYDRKQDS